MEKQSNICPLPWISIETTPTGKYRPCCLYEEEIPIFDLNHALSLNTPEDAYNSKYMQDLRQRFLNGEKPKECSKCWKEEQAGKLSKRMNTILRLHEHIDEIDYSTSTPNQLWFLDLKLGNVCNLKCRICGSWSSSKWAKEEIDIYNGDLHHVAYENLRKGKWPNENYKFWNNLRDLLPNIKYIEFSGGEPFLVPGVEKLLKTAIEYDCAKNIEIHFNTNGTQTPPIEHLRKFKHTTIAYSIDNIDERFEYERYGAKWSIVSSYVEILQKIKEMDSDIQKMKIQLCFTINIQNVYYLDQLLLWAEGKFDSVHWNYLHTPNCMNVQYMTEAAKELVVNNIVNCFIPILPKYKTEFQTLINYINSGPGSDGKEFCNYMKRTDLYRKEDFSKIYPFISKAMGYENE